MRNKALIVIGLLLIALSAAWFFTPLRETVLAALRPETVGARDVGSAPAALDVLNTALNALNAMFGAVGLYLAARGYRLRAPGE